MKALNDDGFALIKKFNKARNTFGLKREYVSTERTLTRREEGPKALAAPLTSYIAQVIFSLPAAVDTSGGYNWRHHGNF